MNRVSAEGGLLVKRVDTGGEPTFGGRSSFGYGQGLFFSSEDVRVKLRDCDSHISHFMRS